MLFLKLLIKYLYLLIIRFLNRLLRFSRNSLTNVTIQTADFGIVRSFLNRTFVPILKKLVRELFPIKILRNNVFSLSQKIKVGTSAKNNRYLLRLLSLNLKTNVCEDSESLILKKFNLAESFVSKGRPMGQPSFISKSFSNEGLGYKSVENVAVTNSTNMVFNRQSIGYLRSIDNVFLHQSTNSIGYLTGDSANGINFNALEDLYNYLTLFPEKNGLSSKQNKKGGKFSASKIARKLKKKNRVPKSFRGGKLFKKQLLSHPMVNAEMRKRNLNTIKQIEYILKNRELLHGENLRKVELNFSEEVKRVMFSSYTPVGAYGKDSVVYSGDLASKSRLMVGRRINLTQQRGFVSDLTSFNSNVGFFNFNTEVDEELEESNSTDDGEGGIPGEFFFINPFVVLGFLCYSVIELFVLFYLMSFFFSNPYDTFRFFFKYPSVYFYENLTGFPSPNYFFFALSFWVSVIVIFCVHILELLDEDEFEPPSLSWVYGFIIDIVYNFLILGCLCFCIFEILNFVDLMVSRVFFFGVPGYPNPFSLLFLLFYDIFYLLGTSNYFSFYLENFLQFEIKFPILYYSEYVPLVQRYPLVQPYFLGNPYLDRPNFFLWLADNVLNFVSGNRGKAQFFTNTDSRFIFQRELIQDIRKYNYVRKNLQDLRFVGHLHARGWNGFNYRLDLQTCIDPILPTEQVMRFDWRLKSSQSRGLHSRLFDGLSFGANKSVNKANKKISMTRGPRISTRYGYLQYLTRLNRVRKQGGEVGGFYHTAPRSIRKRLWLSKLASGDRKTAPPKRRHKSFLFSSGRAKFRLMLNESRRVRTKAERNFKHSRIFRNFWSYIPGNDKPRRYFRRKPFVSLSDFSMIRAVNYARNRATLAKTFIGRARSKLPKVGKYALRALYLSKPDCLYPTAYVNHRTPLFTLRTQQVAEDLRNSRKLSADLPFIRPTRSLHTDVSNESNFFADNNNVLPRKLRVNNKEVATQNLLREKQAYKLKRRVPRVIKSRRVSISKIPNFPFKYSVRRKFISRIFSNFEPKYFLKHTASFTTFSRLDGLAFGGQMLVTLFGGSYPYGNSSGLVYPFGIFFVGLGKLFNSAFPVKLLGFDYYYSQNHNLFFSLSDNYLTKGQLRTMPTDSARFNHPLKGGLRYGWDFLYPMLSELRLTEKILPVDFLYQGPMHYNYRHLRLDPYESIRGSFLTKGACYFLDVRIQNWLNFTNVIWNEYYHFFFNRSFKTEGNGARFVLASYNPIRGPVSYKLFISSPTLEASRVGQFFYTYIPWLQYKFKWLLYPTSTYKRFDSFRFVHQHANKKFYFTSLLKFYQMNLFRWQQAAQIFQWNQLQSRNFLLHLFFHKHAVLRELASLKSFFMGEGLRFKPTCQLLPSDGLNAGNNLVNIDENMSVAIDRFNVLFFKARFQETKAATTVMTSFGNSELYVPAFTAKDFQFFQYAVDLRRWKALQVPYIRDWKFERYIRYLGPLLYREDVASLMGFFAPFDYRNQIFVSRLRNDALRFSVFFPKKVIDEKFVNPLKRLNVPLWVPRSHDERLRSSGGSFYAFVLNRPFLLYSANYATFMNKGKKILSGLYPHFQRFNLETELNFLYGHGTNGKIFGQLNKTFGDILYGDILFSELNSKKKRLLYDKVFWLSKSYELQNLGQQLLKRTDNMKGFFDSKLLNRAILSQLGKPLDLPVPKVLARVAESSKPALQLSDSNTLAGGGSRAATTAEVVKRELINKTRLVQRIHPDIFVRAGGPKISSKQWHMGQSWLKFVIASQNVSVAPISSDSELSFGLGGNMQSSLNDIVSPVWRADSEGFTGLSQQSNFVMSFDTRPKHGYFNFGLGGIGRLPRLSRSFFHMLFFRNKLEGFKGLKKKFLNLYLMSIPLFNKSDFVSNSSFRLFWLFLLGLNNSSVSWLPLRYAFVVNNMFRQYQINFEFSNLLHLSELGTLVPIYSLEHFSSDNILILPDQYAKIKAYRKYEFFTRTLAFYSWNQFVAVVNARKFEPVRIRSDLRLVSTSEVNHWFHVSFIDLPKHFVRKGVGFFRQLLIGLSFDFFNYIFMRSVLVRDVSSTALLFVNQSDKQFKYISSLQKVARSNLLLIPLSNSRGEKVEVHDFFRERLYFGSFRSTLHWYFYPVHSFLFIRDYLSTTLVEYLYQYLKTGVALNFKFWRVALMSTDAFLNFQALRGSWSRSWMPDSFGNTFIVVQPQSDFLESFVRICSCNAFSGMGASSFSIRLLFRLTNPIVLRILFCFGVTKYETTPFYNTFSAFFFSVDFLRFIQKWNASTYLPVSQFAINRASQLWFTDGFDVFSTNLFANVISIDGSGRHNRPRSAAQTLNNIFTYREYEKYRKEHHRQRFRSISPYWLQNSFRNRAHYTYGYRSPENKKRRQMHTALVTMLKRVARMDRYKIHPAHTSRISYFGSLNPEGVTSVLMNSQRDAVGRLTNDHDNSAINFIDAVDGIQTSDVNFHKDRFMRAARSFSATRHAALNSIRRSKHLKDAMFKQLFERQGSLLPEKRLQPVALPSYEHRFFRTPLHQSADLNFSEYNILANIEEGSKKEPGLPMELNGDSGAISSTIPRAESTVSESLRGSPSKAKLIYQKSGYSSFFGGYSKYLINQELEALKSLNYATSFYSDGGNFVNAKKQSVRHDLFQTPAVKSPFMFDSVDNLDLFYELMSELQRKAKDRTQSVMSPKELLEERRKSVSPRAEGASVGVRQRAGVDAYSATSPRYLRIVKPRKKMAGLAHDIIGGIPSIARRNKASYPDVLAKRTTPRGEHRRSSPGVKRYPVNVKRFVRSKSRVLMYIPYLYSKWFTQDPRLSMAVNQELLTIFINNQYDEFNYICVQALLLLKRKIMFNIVNLKFISYKQKILYFSPLVWDSQMQYSSFSMRWIDTLLSDAVKFLFKFYWTFLEKVKLQSVFVYLYSCRRELLSFFFQTDFKYVRLLYNPLVERFGHNSLVSSDMLFFEDFYYKQTAKRVLLQIALKGHSVGGWHNPLGLAGQYIPGLSFYSKGSPFFNFSYQYSDFFSGRQFSPEILMDNNLKRRNSEFFDRNFFFNEFFIPATYRGAWHFLAFRIKGPVSPFIEYDRLHNFPAYLPSSSVKHMHRRLPLLSFRRVHEIAPDHLKGFFSTLVTDSSALIGHDITLPLKLKLLNYALRSNFEYQRKLHQFFNSSASQMKSRILLFSQALKAKQLSVLTEFHNRVNMETLVNKRRLGFRRNVWTPFRYNNYYRFNWRTFLHRFSSSDEIGFRRYKLSPFFDMFQGGSVLSLKTRALQHLVVSQIPRVELDSRRRIPVDMSPKEFNLLLFLYFKYVNANFSNNGYSRLDSKIFKYVNRKVHPFLTVFLLDRNPYFRIFWPQYMQKFKAKVQINERAFGFEFQPRKLRQSRQVPKYTLSGKIIVDGIVSSKSRNMSKLMDPFGIIYQKIEPKSALSSLFEFKFRSLRRLRRVYRKGLRILSNEFSYYSRCMTGPGLLKLFRNRTSNAILNRKLAYIYYNPSLENLQFAKRLEKAVRLLGHERLWLHDFFGAVFSSAHVLTYFVYDSMPVVYAFLDRYVLVNPLPYFNQWYMWFQPYAFRPWRFFFLVDFGSRVGHGKFSKHTSPNPVRRYAQYGFFSEWWVPKVAVSRIFGVHKLFRVQRHRERLLSPELWLNFDLFSRVRPAFRPFLNKFSKQFMFSKIMPVRGIPSYSAFVNSHTKFDNYFERHPYIAFSVGLRATNDLINAEGVYKEVRMRSQMLDFARRHYRNASPVHFKTRKHSFYDYSLFRKNRYLTKRKSRTKQRSMRVYKDMNKLFPFFTRSDSQFFRSRVRLTELPPATGARVGDWSSAETFMNTYDLHYPLRSRRRRLHRMPVHFSHVRGFFKDANFFSVMSRPRRSIKFLNLLILRPYTMSLKFLREDNYPHWLLGSWLSRLFLQYGMFNSLNLDRLSAYYQPNLKIFFDFNAYKQRYNLGLLFRDLSFERDFQFFLLRKARFLDIGDETSKFWTFNSDLELLVAFTNLAAFDYFTFLVPKIETLKGYITESKLSVLYWTVERLITKLTPLYILMVIVDFYLTFLFSLLSMFVFFHKFDFSVFVNLFDINDSIVSYVKKRPIFQVFFHVAVFKEYLKFSWLFSVKFLIFNVEYYPYYFMIFAILLIMRRLALNVQRQQNTHSPFVVPHAWRFSDSHFNSHSGWFDRAWTEVKWESFQRLKNLQASSALEFEHSQLLSFDDIRRFKRKYKLKGRPTKFFELGEEDDPNKIKIDLSKFENVDPGDEKFGNVLTEFNVKGLFSRLRNISFLPPSVESRISDNMELPDSRMESFFTRLKRIRLGRLDKDETKLTDPAQKLRKERKQFPPDTMDSMPITKSFNIRARPLKLSLFLIRQQLSLLLRGKIKFAKFVSDFRVGSARYSDHNINVGNYDVDDFGDEYYRLFLDPEAEFNFFIHQDLSRRRMVPDDENVHFYRKPGSILQNEIMLQKFGTESDQLHYVIEFPGRFNRTYINAFSRAYAIRNLNYNQPQYGFLSFPRNAKLPTTFEEFIIFCGQSDAVQLPSSENVTELMTEKPDNTSLNPNLARLRQLWSLFQYVTKYEYNMINEYNTEDTRVVRLLIEDRPVLFDNIKFWTNKAAVDAVQFNFVRPSFFFLNTSIDEAELVMKGNDSTDRLVSLDLYKGDDNPLVGTTSFLLSILYMFYVYLFLFVYLLVVSFVFCFVYLFFYSLYNYVVFIIS